MASPVASVVIIFLDEERFLGKAIESVLGQTLDDWELLLVDDGSRDASADIAREAARRDPARIRYLAHPDGANHGMSATRNLGLAHARGAIVGFLDGDDVWLPDKLSEQVAVLARQPEAGLVYGRTLIWHSWNAEATEADALYDLGVQPGRLYRPPRLFEVLLENKSQTPTAGNALVRRALIDEVGGFEPAFRGMFEDQVFFAKALLRAPAWVDSRVWARYRQRRDSCTARSATAGADERARLRFLRWLRRYLRAHGALDPHTRRTIAREAFRARVRAGRRRLRRLVRGA